MGMFAGSTVTSFEGQGFTAAETPEKVVNSVIALSDRADQAVNENQPTQEQITASVRQADQQMMQDSQQQFRSAFNTTPGRGPGNGGGRGA